MRERNYKHTNALNWIINIIKAVIEKPVFSTMFLLISTSTLGLDKDTATTTLGLAVTIADLSHLRAKDSIENGMSGITPRSSVSSTIFNDINGNRRQDSGEIGVAGLTIQIFDGNGNEVNVGPDGTLGTIDDSPGGMITDARGGYHFNNLTPDTYRIMAVKVTQ